MLTFASATAAITTHVLEIRESLKLDCIPSYMKQAQHSE